MGIPGNIRSKTKHHINTMAVTFVLHLIEEGRLDVHESFVKDFCKRHNIIFSAVCSKTSTAATPNRTGDLRSSICYAVVDRFNNFKQRKNNGGKENLHQR